MIIQPKLSYGQSRIFDDQYRHLFFQLKPDSLFIYETYTTWGRGPIYFISFRKGEIRKGYLLTKQYLTNLLMPRFLLPKESTLTERIEYIDSSEVHQLLTKISIEKLRQLPNVVDCNAREGDTDGLHYSFTMFSENCSWSKSYYDIYYYLKQCPNSDVLLTFAKIDSLFNSHFPHRDSIAKNIILEYRDKKAK